MIPRPPISTLTDTSFPYTTVFRSCSCSSGLRRWCCCRPHRIDARLIAGVALTAPGRRTQGRRRIMIRNDYPGLNFDLGETADMLRDSVRSFAATEIAPRAADLDRDNTFPHDPRSDARRVGKEWGSTCSSRGSP